MNPISFTPHKWKIAWLLLITLPIIALGCSNQTNTHSEAEPQTPCESAVQHLLDKDFANWQGWPEACTISDLRKSGTIQPDSVSWFMGQEIRQAYWSMLKQEVYEMGVRVWFVEDKVLKVQVEYPGIKDTPHDLIKGWGAPNKADYYEGIMFVEGGEWIFPERGITLRVSAEESMVTEVILYPPTTLKLYMRDIYYTEQEREFPDHTDYDLIDFEESVSD